LDKEGEARLIEIMATAFPCSPYDETSGLVYFPRMLDKIRRRAAGTLPEVYHEYLGQGFDGACLQLLHVEYTELQARVSQGGTDEEILEWCYGKGNRLSAQEIKVWNDFMRKRGWRDETRVRVEFRMKEAGLEARMAEAKTMFDFMDLDEGRTPPDFAKLEPPAR
jgi:gluconokinase